MFSAGEVSADVHAVNLAKKLYELDPNLYLFGVGGERLKAAGVDVKYDIIDMSTVGVIEYFRYYLPLRRAGNGIIKMMEEEQPDVVILIDTQGFNIGIAKGAKARGIPTIFYYPPQAWYIKVYQFGEKVVKEVMETVDHVISTFPREYEVYKKWGDNVTYVGYPDVEMIKPSKSEDEVYKSLGIEANHKVIGIFPGSRWQEVKRLLPVLLQAADKIHAIDKKIEFIVSISAEFLEEYIREQVKGFDFIRVSNELSYNLMIICDAIIACSGTITLEAAVIGVPTVVVYKTSFITYNLGKRILNTPYISHPNIIAGRQILPELIQKEASAETIAAKTLEMMSDPLNRKVRDDLAQVGKKLGKDENILDKASRIIFDLANYE